MSDQQQMPMLEWQNGDLPVSTRFDDPYFSKSDGLAETRHVFLAGNGLPDRFCEGFQIAELGFGTGLNMLAVWRAWLDSDQTKPLKFTSFEAYPLSTADCQRALSAFPEIADLSEVFLREYASGVSKFSLGQIEVEIIKGDARETLPIWREKADAWFLDGFSPAKNPELWGSGLLQDVADHTNDGGTLATYTAAGHIRRTLADVGFDIDRAPGFGRKRHMTTGKLRTAL